MRRFSLFALVAGVLAVTSVSPAARLSAAGSSITGTVKATGLTSNADAVVYVLRGARRAATGAHRRWTSGSFSSCRTCFPSWSGRR